MRSIYLSRAFSVPRYLLVNVVQFPLFSAAFAFTHDLGSMIAMRGLQGFAGGSLIPMAHQPAGRLRCRDGRHQRVNEA